MCDIELQVYIAMSQNVTFVENMLYVDEGRNLHDVRCLVLVCCAGNGTGIM